MTNTDLSDHQVKILYSTLLTLRKARLSVSLESETQVQCQDALADIPDVQRHFKLNDKDIPDFFISGFIAVEVKIKGDAKAIKKQCDRYCADRRVKCLILITNRSMGFPSSINGKDCYVINIGRAWL